MRIEVPATLTQFIVHVEDFEMELNALIAVISSVRTLRRSIRGRLNDCGLDVVNFLQIFVTAHSQASFWVQDDTMTLQTAFNSNNMLETRTRANQSSAGLHFRTAERGLAVAYKGYFFFIRAFQDAAHSALLEILGARSGRYSSMSAILNNRDTPVRRVTSAIDGYEEWFKGFKNRRDQMKVGVGLGLAGPQSDVGVGFIDLGDDNSQSWRNEVIRLKDMMEAIHFCRELIQKMRELAIQVTESLHQDADLPSSA